MISDRSLRLKIAVADDEPAVRTTFVRLLEVLGHEVTCSAANGHELLEGCASEPVDLAFVDLDMPVMDGLAAAEHLALKGIPVILVSGHPDAEYIVLEHEPVVARLSKPATVDRLRAAIRQAVSFKLNSGSRTVDRRQ
jgi:CheY-like chemotaxis protein